MHEHTHTQLTPGCYRCALNAANEWVAIEDRIAEAIDPHEIQSRGFDVRALLARHAELARFSLTIEPRSEQQIP